MTGNGAVTDDIVARIRTALAGHPNMPRTELAELLGISRKTLYKHLGRLGSMAGGAAATPAPLPAPPPKQNHRRPPPPGPHSTAFKPGNPGGPGIPPEKAKGNKNAVTTGRCVRAEEFARDCAAAPVDPATILQEQAKRTQGRLQYMYRLLLHAEQRLEDLATEGDATALSALAIVEVSRKQEPRTKEPRTKDEQTVLVDVELSTKSRSLLDLWHAQHEAITKVELLAGRTADRLKPPAGAQVGVGGIGTLVINNNMAGVDDDGGKET